MFCPRCALQNSDDTKYCRGCGANLESVAVVLGNRTQVAGKFADDPVADAAKWAEKQSKGANHAIQGSILTGSAVAIALALALFWAKQDWLILWVIFFSWLAAWGVIQLAWGLGNLIEAKLMLRHLQPPAMPAAPATQALEEKQ